jgi:hypothetical protein
MYHIFKKLISQEECEFLNQKALEYKDKKKLHHEGSTDPFYKNSFGTAQIPEFESLLHRMTPTISETFKIKNIAAENSYTRIYYNGSILGRHIDREGLDLTMSLCTFTNLENPWPLYFETLEGEVKSADLEVGDAAVILGTKMYHWRDPLVCPEDQYTIMSFYHWRKTLKLKFL